jgi:hypothetical protein
LADGREQWFSPIATSCFGNFKCESPLQFPAADFKTWDCYGWKCAGMLIDPERKVRN